MQNLKQVLSQWDGKSQAAIQQIYQEHARTHNDIGEILACMDDSQATVGASWMLKAWLTERPILDAQATRQMLTLLNHAQHWETRLHLLQCLPALTIPDDMAAQLHRTLEHYSTSHKRFVRAWAYGGLYHLAAQYQGFRDEVKARLATAMVDEAPSVKARIRQVTKTALW